MSENKEDPGRVYLELALARTRSDASTMGMFRAQAEAGRLSRIIHRQRLAIKELRAMLSPPPAAPETAGRRVVMVEVERRRVKPNEAYVGKDIVLEGENVFCWRSACTSLDEVDVLGRILSSDQIPYPPLAEVAEDEVYAAYYEWDGKSLQNHDGLAPEWHGFDAGYRSGAARRGRK